MARHALLLVLTVIAVAALACVDPKDRRPGLRLSGEVAEAPVEDWSFTDGVQEIFLETRTAYGVPHSVTTVCAAAGDALYVPSVYFEGGEWPAKFWNRNVVRDPRVRVEIDGVLYEREAVVVDDAAERERALRALAGKYPFWQEQLAKPPSERFDMALLRLDPRREAEDG